MYLFRRVYKRLARALIARVSRRPPDFIIGGPANPYCLRWWLIPRNPVFNIYLHKFLRDDDDRALHDHPWPWCSIILQGGYVEHTIRAGGIHQRRQRFAPSIKVALPWRAHRVELLHAWWMQEDLDEAFEVWAQRPNDLEPAWTLFITGPRMRAWGFHCQERGWVPWEEFTAADDPGAIGPGCAEPANDNYIGSAAHVAEVLSS